MWDLSGLITKPTEPTAIAEPQENTTFKGKIADILTELTIKTEGLITGQTPLRDENLSKGGRATARFKDTIQGYPIDWEAWEKPLRIEKTFIILLLKMFQKLYANNGNLILI